MSFSGWKSISVPVMLLIAAAAMSVQESAPPARPVVAPKVVPQQTAVAATPAPVSLSDPDGQELVIEDLAVRTAVHGMLSLTEIEFRFRNPQPRRIEGRFSCALPPGAAISRFAKEVNGRLMEGEVVERLRANQVYEQFLHQMRDPALLEQDQGNRFSARIFPIEANATVRILLSYSSLLPMKQGVRTYAFPLRGIAKIDHFSFRGVIAPLPGESGSTAASKAPDDGGFARSTVEVLTRDETNFTPHSDIVLTWRADDAAPRNRVYRAGDFYVAALRPELPPVERRATPREWVVYVDTSASAADGAAHAIAAVESFLRALPADAHVVVRAFDQEIVPLGEGTPASVASSIGASLRRRLFLGATDLAAVLRDIAESAKRQGGVAYVVMSDVTATAGETDRKALGDAAARIAKGTQLHVVTLGSRTDAAVAKMLVSGRGRVASIPYDTSLAAHAAAAAAQLLEPPGAAFDVSDASAEWVYPSRVEDVRSGDEVIVLGKLKAGAATAVQLGGRTSEVSERGLPAESFAPLLEREAWRAYLDYLGEREAREESDAVRRALATEQVRISVAQRVVIPRTTMLVLESEWDYQRFGIDRRALAQILTVDATGIGRLDRSAAVFLAPPPPVAAPVVRPRPMERGAAAKVFDAAPPAPSFIEDAVTETRVLAQAEERDGNAERENAPSAVAHNRTTTGTSVAAPPPPPPPPSAVSEAISVPPTERGGVAEAITVAPTRRERRRIVQGAAEKITPPDWTKRELPSRSRLRELEERHAADPKDREAWNQLAETYAALSMWGELRRLATAWQPFDPENPQVYEMLGLAAESSGDDATAARAYGSLVEVAPGKMELLQRAGLLLLRVGKPAVAEAPLRRALEVRPDRVNGYRHLALLLMMSGRLDEAARVLESATKQAFPAWYGNAQRVVREELGYVYRAMIAADATRRQAIEARAREFGADLARTDALRVTLAWETDANDVDLHVVDPSGEEAFYGHPATASGLALYEDITQGLGPEVIRTSSLKKGTYHVGVRYFAAGPMGVSRGIAIVMREKGSALPAVEIVPFRLVQGGGDIRYLLPVIVK